MSATVTTEPTPIRFTFYGAAGELFECEAPEVVISGPAGTGKTRCSLEKLHYLLATHPNLRALMVRKTLQSLKTSAILTYEEKVQPALDGVIFKNESRREAAHYLYPNGSKLYIGGMDKPVKVMSSEYDLIYVPEATELHEQDWDALTTRLRNGRLPYQQLFGDCNPDAPTHWLRKRMDTGRCKELPSRYEDNPALWDGEKDDWTPQGTAYIARLDNLTGVRYLRLRRGIWAAAEGMVYQDSWDRSRNLIPRSAVCKRLDLWGDCGIPREWPRYVVIDFGYTHPFVAKWYAEDGDGRLYRYREIYTTHRLVEDHAKLIMEKSGWGKTNGDPLPRAIICDHDAEGRATLEHHLGMMTIAAHKAVTEGIQAVAARWRPAGDGKPRLYYLDGALIERDPYLVDAKLPTCSEEEIESYIWDTRKEAPVKEHDHGQDTDRYLCAYRDLRGSEVEYVEWLH